MNTLAHPRPVISPGNSETITKMMCWGNIRTGMFETYVHMTGSDIDNEVLTRQGIHRPETERSEAMDPRICEHCHTINAPGHQFCSRCGRSLTKEEKLELEEAVREIEAHPIYQHLMEEARSRVRGMVCPSNSP